MERSPELQASKVSPGHIKAVLKEDLAQVTNLSEKRVKGASDLDKAQFLNGNDGWAANKTWLYRTSDGGNTWEQIALNLPAYSYISSFFFMTRDQGWLTFVTKANLERYGVGYSSRVMSTIDGGRNWTERTIFNDEVEIKLVKFLNPNEGFAIGSRSIDDKPPYPEGFLSRTEDGGNTWKDLSTGLNLAIKNEFGKSNDYGADIHWITSSRILLLTGLGKILITSDSGKTWSLIAQLQDGRPQTGYQKIFSDNSGKLQVVAGTISEEGFWGSLIVKNQDSSWTNFELSGVPIFDALFPSKEEVVACGGQFQGFGASGPTYKGRALAGMILHSLDGGKTWSVVYRLRVNQPIVYLYQVEGHRFYAIGNDGTFLQFDL